MKKIIIIFLIIIASIGIISYNYAQKKVIISDRLMNNKEYENLYLKTIKGSQLATLINRTMDKNYEDGAQKDERNYYIDNNKNSIIIEVKFKDNDNKFRMEQIYNKEISKFVNLYSNKDFKCEKLNYHDGSKLVKYLYFEEV